MYCPDCGTELPDDSRYCASCGLALTEWTAGPDRDEAASEPGDGADGVPERTDAQTPPERDRDRPGRPRTTPENRQATPGAEHRREEMEAEIDADAGMETGADAGTDDDAARTYLGRFANISYFLGGLNVFSFFLLIGAIQLAPAATDPYRSGLAALLLPVLAVVSLVAAVVYLAVGFAIARESRLGWWIGMAWFTVSGLLSVLSVAGIVFHVLGLYWGYRGRDAVG